MNTTATPLSAALRLEGETPGQGRRGHTAQGWARSRREQPCGTMTPRI